MELCFGLREAALPHRSSLQQGISSQMGTKKGHRSILSQEGTARRRVNSSRVKHVEDFVAFLARLVRDGVAISLLIFDGVLFGVGWWWKYRYRVDFPIPTWMYGTILALGLLLAAYRNDRMLRAQIQEAEALKPDEPTPMDTKTFERLVASSRKSEG